MAAGASSAAAMASIPSTDFLFMRASCGNFSLRRIVPAARKSLSVCYMMARKVADALGVPSSGRAGLQFLQAYPRTPHNQAYATALRHARAVRLDHALVLSGLSAGANKRRRPPRDAGVRHPTRVVSATKGNVGVSDTYSKPRRVDQRSCEPGPAGGAWAASWSEGSPRRGPRAPGGAPELSDVADQAPPAGPGA